MFLSECSHKAVLRQASCSERVFCLAVPLLAERWRFRLQLQCGGRCEISRQWCTVGVKGSVCVHVRVRLVGGGRSPVTRCTPPAASPRRQPETLVGGACTGRASGERNFSPPWRGRTTERRSHTVPPGKGGGNKQE